ncbi:hypothetical protein JCM8547_007417 [Rhodosporidiobolus lusitaniae]
MQLRTPQKNRTASPLSPLASRPSTPARGGAPGVSRVKGAGGATASPQVKAALAALRKQRQASESSSANNALLDSPDEQDPFSTPARDANRTGRVSASTSVSSRSGTPSSTRTSRREGSEGEVLLEWAVKGEDRLIEGAKKSGLLNLASRSLTSVPPAVYSSLLPRTSTYHPSNRRDPTSFRKDKQLDLKIASFEDDADGETAAKWYEQQELKSLNLSSNEIASLEDEIGGFEDLEAFDVHNNLLSSLPLSAAWLVHLTSLNLSGNRLSSFPLPLLNLRHLKDLNLAANSLTSLWHVDWKVALADRLSPPGASPSATPESPERGESFWDSFPSSPFNRANQPSSSRNNSLTSPPSQSRAPFPLLTTLSLASNPLSRDALTQDGFELPPRLTNLDLSECGLVDSTCPPELFGTLRNLVELDVSGNDLADDLFASDLFPPSSSSSPPSRLFPALKTLHLSRNPLDSLASLEAFLTLRVSRPISYVGLPKPLQNLIFSEERQLRIGRRIGVPEDVEKGREGAEVEVRVGECLLRAEQVRRRSQFPETEPSRRRMKELEEARGEEAKEVLQGGGQSCSSSASAPRPGVPHLAAPRTCSPSPPPSPSPSAPSAAAAQPPATPSSSSRRHVILEDWELEAAAGLTTPAGRRRAAAQAAKERAERMRREEEEKERMRERKRAEEDEEERQAREMEERMEKMRLEEEEKVAEEERRRTVSGSSSRTESASPPPYTPRAPGDTPNAPAARPVAPQLPSAPLVPVEAPLSDPAVQLISSALSILPTSASKRTSLVLSSRSLTSLPIPSTGSAPSSLAPSSPSQADFSRNALPTFPLRGIEYWGWNKTLRSLELSRNRIAAVEVLSLGTASREGEAFFPLLDKLDLSHNFLPTLIASPFSSSSSGGGEETPLLSTLARLAPSLVSLSLHHNRLTSLSGISPLLLPPLSGAKGLKHLNLSENKIEDVQELCEVAERNRREGEGKEGRWRVEELDLSSNEIAKLPPQLGHLPLSLLLHLTGNTFRMPRREVYENAAERKVVPWLREWLEAM